MSFIGDKVKKLPKFLRWIMLDFRRGDPAAAERKVKAEVTEIPGEIKKELKR